MKLVLVEDDDDGMSLTEARAWLQERLDKGTHCPACDQYAKRYRRQMTSFTAMAMCAMWRHYRHEFVHMPDLVRRHLPKMTQGGYATLGKYWGLVEEEHIVRPDGGRAGWWKLTAKGRAFVLCSVTVARKAVVYDGKLLWYEGDQIDIREVLTTKFNLEELLGG